MFLSFVSSVRLENFCIRSVHREGLPHYVKKSLLILYPFSIHRDLYLEAKESLAYAAGVWEAEKALAYAAQKSWSNMHLKTNIILV